MKEPTIQFFNKCLIRTPVFPASKLSDVETINTIIENPYFKDAIHIASKPLYEDVYLKGIVNEKTRLGILRYFVRACTRATPFGNFAGFSCLDMGEDSTVQLNKTDAFKTYTRVDMDVLCRIGDTIEKDPVVKDGLLFHVNTSLYPIADRLRYIEYDKQNGKRHYIFSEIINNEYIEQIIRFLHKKQCSIDEIANILVSSEITKEEAVEFVNTLIDNQILVSNLEVSIAGDDLLHQMQDTLKNSQYAPMLSELNQAVKNCDEVPFGSKIECYETVNHLVEKLVSNYSTSLFHSDCKIQTTHGIIGKDIQKAFLKGIKVLNRLTAPYRNASLDSFKDAFYKKYEEQEIPLSIALDPQVGIPIGKWDSQYGDDNPLIDNIALPGQNGNGQYSIKPFDKLLIDKFDEYLQKGLDYIQLTEKDLETFPENEFPSFGQLFSIIQVLQTGSGDNDALIFMNNANLGNAAALLSRFEYSDTTTQQFVDTITQQQQQSHPDKIFAEILHLPEDRLGNIQMHPINRDYGIAYFSNPFDKDNRQTILSINDIMVSVPYGQRIKLRSKELDKEIIPLLSTAHNYTMGLPIYLFLCSVSQQESRFLNFEWSNHFSTRLHLPQVRFENIILSPAKWAFSLSELPKIKLKEIGQDDIEKVIEWKNSRKIPDEIMIVEGDNKLYIDFNKPDLVRVLISLLKRNKTMLVEEYLYSQHAKHLVQRENEWFTNELIMCAYYDRD